MQNHGRDMDPSIGTVLRTCLLHCIRAFTVGVAGVGFNKIEKRIQGERTTSPKKSCPNSQLVRASRRYAPAPRFASTLRPPLNSTSIPESCTRTPNREVCIVGHATDKTIENRWAPEKKTTDGRAIALTQDHKESFFLGSSFGADLEGSFYVARAAFGVHRRCAGMEADAGQVPVPGHLH